MEDIYRSVETSRRLQIYWGYASLHPSLRFNYPLNSSYPRN